MPAAGVHLPVAEEGDDGTQHHADHDGDAARLPVRLLGELQGDGADENACSEGHDQADQAMRDVDDKGDDGSEQEGDPSDEASQGCDPHGHSIGQPRDRSQMAGPLRGLVCRSRPLA